MTQTNKTRVLLQVDYLTKKVLGFQLYSGDGKGVSCYVDDLDFLQNAHKRGVDLFWVNKHLVERPKQHEDFYDKKFALEQKLQTLKKQERACYLQYVKQNHCKQSQQRLVECTVQKQQTILQLQKLVKQRNNQIRNHVCAKLQKTKFKHYVSICLIIKDDNEYLEEWLNWHVAQGVEHFYIYDHGSKTPVSEFMQTLPQSLQQKVTVHNFGGKHDFAQHDAYNRCLKKYKTESRWIGFVDSDEMVRVKDGRSLPEFLKDYQDFAGVFLGWITYNANGQAVKGKQPVRERFPNPSPFNNQVGVGKVFVQPYCMQQMLTHNGYPVDGFFIVDENKVKVKDGEAWHQNLTTNIACIDHYYTKSYEEWVEKITRGSCDPYYTRKYYEFFLYNPDLIHCKASVAPVQKYEATTQKTSKI